MPSHRKPHSQPESGEPGATSHNSLAVQTRPPQPSPPFHPPRQSQQLAEAAVAALVLLLYLLFASGGMMTSVPPTSDVYAQLAEAFSHGQLHLLLEPPPELAAIADPYDPAARTGIEVSTDASYYRGHYYAYWGPAPALMAAAWKVATQRPIGDSAIALLASGATFLFALRFLRRLRRSAYPETPLWLYLTSLAAVGLAHPTLWNLNYPAIYEAAIASGQALLLAGLLLAAPAMSGFGGPRRFLAAACALWGLAIAARWTLLPAVAVLVLGTGAGLLVSHRRDPRQPSIHPLVLSLALPLVLVASLLGAYNYLRFGHVAETGLQYQLVPDVDYPDLMVAGEIFSPRYLAPNILYYSVAPPALSKGFPFLITIPRGQGWMASLVGVPAIARAHRVDEAIGVLVAAPFAVFAAMLLIPGAAGAKDGAGSHAAEDARSTQPTLADGHRVALTVLAAAVAAALPALLYRHVATRFELDFVPMLLVASSIGAWGLWQTARGRPILQPIVTAALILSAGITLVAGILLGASRG